MTFDYTTAADLIHGKIPNLDKVRLFVSNAKYDYDTCKSLCNVISDLRAQLTQREGEIAMLKELLMAYENNVA